MIFLEKNFLQVRMASGEEMICEVMEWPDEHSKEMVVRNAMMLTISWTEDEDGGEFVVVVVVVIIIMLRTVQHHVQKQLHESRI